MLLIDLCGLYILLNSKNACLSAQDEVSLIIQCLISRPIGSNYRFSIIRMLLQSWNLRTTIYVRLRDPSRQNCVLISAQSLLRLRQLLQDLRLASPQIAT